MQRNCYQRGSVVLDSRTTTWFFRYRAESRQKSVRLGKFATKKAALQAADSVRTRINSGNEEAKPLIANLWEMYKNEKMPTKLPTRLAYDSWTRNHILPRWAGITPATERNPISLVKVEHATRRRKPRSLTVEEFQKVAIHLKEPLRSMAILAVTLGLRASEVLALKWRHVDWLNRKLSVEQRIYRQHVDDTKTRSSSAELDLDPSVLQVLKAWRQVSQFRGEEDWMWASRTQLGRLPISYPWYWRCFNDAAIKAGIGPLGTHTLRHTYRSWMDSVGTPIAVQQKLMRHSDIRTTMNVYGDVVDDRMKEAHSKVAALVFTSAALEKGSSTQRSEERNNVGSASRSV